MSNQGSEALMMDDQAATTLKVLASFFHGGEIETLTRFLPEEEAEAVGTSAMDGLPSLDGLVPVQNALAKIHYSWVVPTLNKYPKELQPFFLGALPENVRKGIRTHFPDLAKEQTLTPTLARFFSSLLYSDLVKNERVPRPFIPNTDLSPLLECNKQQLLHVIDLLGLWDLAASYRKIIDQKQLKTILTLLSPNQREYLEESIRKSMVKKKESTLPLHGLNGDATKLQKLLHRRGLRRLGGALAGHPDSMRWYITRTLDRGRGQILSQYFSADEESNEVTEWTSQTLSALNFLKSDKIT